MLVDSSATSAASILAICAWVNPVAWLAVNAAACAVVNESICVVPIDPIWAAESLEICAVVKPAN